MKSQEFRNLLIKSNAYQEDFIILNNEGYGYPITDIQCDKDGLVLEFRIDSIYDEINNFTYAKLIGLISILDIPVTFKLNNTVYNDTVYNDIYDIVQPDPELDFYIKAK